MVEPPVIGTAGLDADPLWQRVRAEIIARFPDAGAAVTFLRADAQGRLAQVQIAASGSACDAPWRAIDLAISYHASARRIGVHAAVLTGDARRWEHHGFELTA